MSTADRNDRVFNQDCADYLSHMGYVIRDGIGTNAPYRSTANSESFVCHGPLYYDHSHGEGGNIWQLALKMHDGNATDAIRSLHEAAGIPFVENPAVQRHLDRASRSLDALAKAMEIFAIGDHTPGHVRNYLSSRMVTGKSLPMFGYVNAELLGRMPAEQVALTGLERRCGEIIFWYLRGGGPVYYCTRKVDDKEFRKADLSLELSHPIWNIDDLYNKDKVVWGEGMFDCASLLELGYGVSGEVTCNAIKAHMPDLVRALRWRRKHRPDWEFTICLDNDEPGRRAAENLARFLWGKGLDIRWVRHATKAEKVDINQLHVDGEAEAVREMLAGAKRLSEIFKESLEFCRHAFQVCMAEGDYAGGSRFLELLEKHDKDKSFARTMREALEFRIDYREVYEGVEMFLHDGDYYVIPHDGRQAGGQDHLVFRKNHVIDNARRWQRNPAQSLSLRNLDIPARVPTWRVTRDDRHDDGNTFNLFQSGPLLLQTPVTDAKIPPMWDGLMDNLAGAKEREWLLNHVACWLQTMSKPRTIPVLVGGQGTGKTTLFSLLGEAVGGFAAVGNDEVESQFNEWLMHPVVLMDELASSDVEAKRVKCRLKALINEHALINAKHQRPYSIKLNNYLAIASNERVACVPLVIEGDDRRYSVVTGGKDANLAHENWFSFNKLKEQLPEFILHLLSRSIDVEAANIPLVNDRRREMIELSEDPRITAVREWLDTHGTGEETLTSKRIVDSLIWERHLEKPVSARKLAIIMRELGREPQLLHNQYVYSGLSSTAIGPFGGGDLTEETWSGTES